jgi:hypothetical protein
VDKNPVLKHVNLGMDELIGAEEERWESHHRRLLWLRDNRTNPTGMRSRCTSHAIMYNRDMFA